MLRKTLWLLSQPGKIPKRLFDFSLNRFARFYRPAVGGRLFRGIEKRFFFRRNFDPARQVFDAFVEHAGALFPAKKQARPASKGTALVFTLHGQSAFHNAHQVLIAASLDALGYDVRYVVCQGMLERCGSNQLRTPEDSPPFTCRACRTITGVLADGPFPVIPFSLLEDEAGRRAEVEPLADTPATNIDSFMIRFFQGDFTRLENGDPEVGLHRAAGARVLARLNALLDREQPRVVALFNGLSFPQNLIGRACEERGIDVVYVERGMRRNSMFLALNDPACHYRSTAYWTRQRERIQARQIRMAESLLQARLTSAEDPSGRARQVTGRSEDDYRALEREPFTLLFAPVNHDTASLEKAGVFRNFLHFLEEACRTAAARKKLLLIRAHPDELNPANPSLYPTERFLRERGLLDSPYVRCLGPAEVWSGYRLAEMAAAVLVYNGTLGMELPALGHQVFNVAASHYAGKGFTRSVDSPAALAAVFDSSKAATSPEQRRDALRYLYYYAYRVSLPIDSLVNEFAPFQFRVDERPAAVRQRQARRVKNYIEFLLSSSDSH